MIKFFRHIRKQLLTEGKTGKYFKYAVGEIVLVVIGILIALQINNWNEERNTSRSEQVFLTQILKSLQSDLGRTNLIYKNRALKKQEAINSFLNNLNKDILPHDSILWPSFWDMTLTLSFIYDKGAYESLKSKGLEIIKNDTLRQKIVRTYENDLPLGIEFIGINKDLNAQLRNTYLQKLIEYDFKMLENGQWSSDTDIDFMKIKENKTLKQLISLETRVASNYMYRLKDLISDFEDLILHVKNELTKSK